MKELFELTDRLIEMNPSDSKTYDEFLELRSNYNKNKEESILCAAIWYKDFDSPYHTVTNIDCGVVLCGYRHSHIIGQMLSIVGLRTVSNGEKSVGEHVQGFLTTKNRFLNREEAYAMFVAKGGSPDFKDKLYSEDLY